MKLDKKRRMAARVLGVGVHRVWINPERAEDVSASLTREDIRALVKAGVIGVKPERGVSRGRARRRAEKRRKGKRRGHGRRKGARGARAPRKLAWIRTVRAVRRRLRELRREGTINPGQYRRLYRMARGGAFRSRAHLETYLREKGILKG